MRPRERRSTLAAGMSWDPRSVGRFVLASLASGFLLVLELIGKIPPGSGFVQFLLPALAQYLAAVDEVDWVKGDELGSLLGGWKARRSDAGCWVSFSNAFALGLPGRTVEVAEGLRAPVGKLLSREHAPTQPNESSPRRLDPSAVTLLVFGTLIFVVPLVSFSRWVSPQVMLSLCVGILAAGAWLFHEAHGFLRAPFDAMGTVVGSRSLRWSEVTRLKAGVLFPWRIRALAHGRWHVINLMLDAHRAESLNVILANMPPEAREATGSP